MKGLVILADGFEDTEAIMTIDILKRAGCEVTTASPTGNLKVISSFNLQVSVEKNLYEIDVKDFQFLVIPGGRAVEAILKKSEIVRTTILAFAKAQKLLAAICAAPSLLINYGLLENTEYTCFPAYENLALAPLYRDKPLVVTKNVITAKAMAYTKEFALAIVKHLLGEKISQKVEKQIRGEK